ncbi:MAG: DUF4338 domain-containing protein [Deltaproteobacteria bacterium]|nr:DUF4338 domain-containing protein [Deltaproteobacteria bacterium]
MHQAETRSIFQCGREISREELDEIEETVRLFPALSRSELARTICEHLGWFTASGGYKTDACLKLLHRLEGKGCLRLPPKRAISPQRHAPIALTPRTRPRAEIVGNVREVGPLRVEVVEGRDPTALWNEYVSRYHYLSYKRPFGYSLRYFVRSPHDILGCLLFQGAAKALKARDEWIGWTRTQRLRNLPWVINNSRFLVLPWVKVKNLGSHILGQALRRIRDDWQERWGYRPLVVESFVDPQRYEGSSYKAANWVYLGMSTGKGLPRKGKRYTTTPKKIFVRALARDFRKRLCSERLQGRVEQ